MQRDRLNNFKGFFLPHLYKLRPLVGNLSCNHIYMNQDRKNRTCSVNMNLLRTHQYPKYITKFRNNIDVVAKGNGQETINYIQLINLLKVKMKRRYYNKDIIQ